MNRNERINHILDLVAKSGSLDVESTVKTLQVSAATIRRDFDELAKKQLVNRTHGGIQAIGAAYGLPIRYKTARDDRGKTRIAQAAARMVPEGAVIGLNGGTTTTELARALATSPQFSSKDNKRTLTIVTNAVNIAAELVIRPQIKVVVTGGVARPQSYELIGDYATQVMEGLVLDIAFLGVNGFDPVVGATANHEGEAKVDQLIAESAKKVVVVSTANKVGHQAFARFAKPEQVDTLITDQPLSIDLATAFAEKGVEVIVC
jgi:DeoR family transcriptional regulator of aga operon